MAARFSAGLILPVAVLGNSARKLNCWACEVGEIVASQVAVHSVATAAARRPRRRAALRPNAHAEADLATPAPPGAGAPLPPRRKYSPPLMMTSLGRSRISAVGMHDRGVAAVEPAAAHHTRRCLRRCSSRPSRRCRARRFARASCRRATPHGLRRPPAQIARSDEFDALALSPRPLAGVETGVLGPRFADEMNGETSVSP